MAGLIGQTVGQYKIEALLGSGGMAVVYRGSHVFLNRVAAIKILHASFANNANIQARFLQEAQTAAALKHPNIIEIYDFGHQADVYFLIMQLANSSMRDLLQKNAVKGQLLPLPLSLDLVRQAADGLAFAHGKGTIHRDIKPDNLLLNQASPTNYIVKVADFGLARLAEGSVLTVSGTPMGTPAYMSPEQCLGAAVDARTDIYALGVVLYEAATGYLPFSAKTISEAAYKHVHVQPEPPRRLKPDLPADIESLILRCLAKNPAERFANADSLSQALQAAASIPGRTGISTVRLPSDSVDKLQSAALGNTVMREPYTQAAPPAPSTVVTGTITPLDLPRVRVQDQTGAVIQVVNVTQEGVTVGRAGDNTIRLASQDVSSHHLRIHWDGTQVSVTDLSSTNGTFAGDRRLPANQPEPWGGQQPLRVGTYWLRLRIPASGAGNGAAHGNDVRRNGPVDRAESLSVTLESAVLTLTPGQPQAYRVSLLNTGLQVGHFNITVDGVPAHWVQGEREIQLNPDMRQTTTLTVLAPRTPASQAAHYNVIVRARSRENPAESGSATAVWTVLPFGGTSLSIAPQRASGRTGAPYTLTLRNEGNAAADIALSATDEERKLRFTFANREQIGQLGNQTPAFRLGAGQAATIGLKVSAPRRWIGSAQLRPFVTQATIQGAQATAAGNAGAVTIAQQQATAQFNHLALIPTWLPPVAIAVLLGLCILLYALIVKPPTLEVYKIDPTNPVAGQRFTVYWHVSSDVDTLTFLPVGTVVDAQAGQYTFEDGLPALSNLELVATNRFGSTKQPVVGVVNLATATNTPTAIPTQELGPPVCQLEPQGLEKSIVKGEQVEFSWSVTNANAVTFNGTTVEATGKLTVAPEETNTYTLVATNKAGKQCSIAIKIVVKAPTATPLPTTAPQLIPTAISVPTSVPQPTATATPLPPAPTPTPALTAWLAPLHMTGDNQKTYLIRLTQPGLITVDASWSTNTNNLSFSIQDKFGMTKANQQPDNLSLAPSLTYMVTASDFEASDTWQVTIINIVQDRADGTITINYPTGNTAVPGFTDQFTVIANQSDLVYVLVPGSSGTVSVKPNGAPAGASLILTRPSGGTTSLATPNGDGALSYTTDPSLDGVLLVDVHATGHPTANGQMVMKYP